MIVVLGLLFIGKPQLKSWPNAKENEILECALSNGRLVKPKCMILFLILETLQLAFWRSE